MASVEAFLAILHPNPHDRLQALTNSLFTELKRFDCLVNAELEIVRLTNPHIHVNAYSFLISDIRTGYPLITFNPPRRN